jgi:TonB family protein
LAPQNFLFRSRKIFWRCVMRHEPQRVSEEIPEESLGSLRACLVEGDAEQRTRERHVRRRALAVSILLQSAVLTLLVLIPLFGKTERIALGRDYVPISPYGRASNHPRGNTKPTTGRPSDSRAGLTFNTSTNKPHLPAGGAMNPIGSSDDDPIGPGPAGPGCDWCVNIGGKNSGPRPPQPANETPSKPQVVRITTLDPAMLLHRVEPVYPPLPKQMHREGRVELRAIIGTDGNIQSLQVVAGDPLFVQSAVDAVQQWHYKPTYLNGQPVEIDTYITIVYTMQH